MTVSNKKKKLRIKSHCSNSLQVFCRNYSSVWQYNESKCHLFAGLLLLLLLCDVAFIFFFSLIATEKSLPSSSIRRYNIKPKTYCRILPYIVLYCRILLYIVVFRDILLYFVINNCRLCYIVVCRDILLYFVLHGCISLTMVLYRCTSFYIVV